MTMMSNYNMIKRLLTSLLLAFAGMAHAASEGVAWDRFPTEKLADQASLQNGAKLFVNYCLNCHAASYMRFNRMQDIGLSPEQIKNNLLFTTDKVGETMKVAIDAKQAKEWFGATPPDLSVIARSRSAAGQGSGADYLYTYLRTYYRDDSKPTGWNNLAYPNVAMPHVLWELQGERKPIFEKKMDHGHEAEVFTGKWEVIKVGTRDPRASRVGQATAAAGIGKSSANTGLPSRKPWPRSTPTLLKWASWRSVSMPSAITGLPSVCDIATTAFTIALPSRSSGRSLMKARSILTWSKDSCLR